MSWPRSSRSGSWGGLTDTHNSVRIDLCQAPAKICKNAVKMKPEWKILQTDGLTLTPPYLKESLALGRPGGPWGSCRILGRSAVFLAKRCAFLCVFLRLKTFLTKVA